MSRQARESISLNPTRHSRVAQAAVAGAQSAGVDRFVVLLVAIAFVWWEAVLALRLWAFDFWDWDLAIFSQMMWNLSHGNPYSSIMQVHVLGNHANLIAYPLAPLYTLIPHPFVLLTLKVACCVLGALPLAHLAQAHCGRMIARCLVIAYLLYPPLTQALYYDFDFESLSPLVVLGMWLAFVGNRWRLFGFLSLVTVLIKENLPLVVAMFGLVGVFRHREKWRWAAVTAAALAYFALAVFVIVPHARGEVASAYWTKYAHLGRSPAEVVTSVFLRPGHVLQVAFAADNRSWLWQLLAPTGLLGILGLDRLLVGLPIFLQHLLSRDPSEHTIHFSYGALPTPFIFLATLAGISRLLRAFPRPHTLRLVIGTVLIVSSVWAQAVWGAIPPLISTFRTSLVRDALDDRRAQVIRRIPRDAPVVATFAFLPSLSGRPRLYGFHNVYMNRRRMAEPDPYELPDGVEHVLIDVNDGQMVAWLTKRAPQLARNLHAFYHSHPWEVAEVADSLVLLTREDAPARRLYEVSDQEVLLPPGTYWGFEGGLRLLKPDTTILGSGAPTATVPLTLTWQARSQIETVYAVLITWIDERGNPVKQALHPIGYRIYPTWMWTPNRVVREHLSLVVPSEPSARQYQLVAHVVDETNQRVVSLEGSGQGGPARGTVVLGTIQITGGSS